MVPAKAPPTVAAIAPNPLAPPAMEAIGPAIIAKPEINRMIFPNGDSCCLFTRLSDFICLVIGITPEVFV